MGVISILIKNFLPSKVLIKCLSQLFIFFQKNSEILKNYERSMEVVLVVDT